jgi:hypothetical protein
MLDNSAFINSNPGLNFGTNRSIRRAKDNDELPYSAMSEFKINQHAPSDDILSQLKSNLINL